jgi:uncharacterized protein (DUF885 family)
MLLWTGLLAGSMDVTAATGASTEAPPTEAAPAQATPVQQSFDAFADEFAADWMRANPAAATLQQYFSGAEQDALDRELTAVDQQYGMPLNASALHEYIVRARAGLDRLRDFSRQDLTPVQQVSAAMLEWQLADAMRMAAFADQRFVFDQFRGLQVGLVNFLSQVHPVRTARDVDNYLVRLRRVAAVLDEGIDVARQRADKGTLPPKFILQATIDGIDRFLAATPADNVLVTSLATRARAAGLLDQEERDAAVAAATRIVTDSIRPAFERVRALLAVELPAATDDAGMWRLPHGEAGYAAALRVNTTTDLSARQIHVLGLREVKRITAEMERRLRALGYREGSGRIVSRRWTRACSRRRSPIPGRRCSSNTNVFCAMLKSAPARCSICGRRRPCRCCASRRSLKRTRLRIIRRRLLTGRVRARYGYPCRARSTAC